MDGGESGLGGLGSLNFLPVTKAETPNLFFQLALLSGQKENEKGWGLKDVSSQTSKMESDSLLHIQTKTDESRNMIIFSQLQKRHHSLGYTQLHQAKLLGSFPLDRLLHLYLEWFNGPPVT